MRGADEQQPILFSYRAIEDRIPADHPLRAMRRLVDPLLVELSPRFATLYATTGRPSIPPEHLLRALLLQVLYTIRSERQLMEQLDYNLLYRWFVGLTPDDAVWVPTVFTKNRDRLLAGNIAEARRSPTASGLCTSLTCCWRALMSAPAHSPGDKCYPCSRFTVLPMFPVAQNRLPSCA
jgi:transposase